MIKAAIWLFLVFVAPAYALQPTIYWDPSHGEPRQYTSPEAACGAVGIAATNEYAAFSLLYVQMTGPSSGQCHFAVSYHQSPSSNQSDWPYGYVTARYFCPDLTEVGSATDTCPDNCPLGQFLGSDGKCVKDCTKRQGLGLPNDIYSVGSGGVANFGGCEISCAKRTEGMGIGLGGSAGPMEFIGEGCTYTGHAERPENPSADGTGKNKPKQNDPKTPEGCLANGQGYVQSSTGGTTCVPASAAPEGQKPNSVTEKKTTTSSTNGGSANGGKETTKTSETTRTGDFAGGGSGSGSGSGGGSGGKVTKTETTTTTPDTDGNGNQSCPSGFVMSGGVCTKTEVTESDAKSFCDENPTSYVCGDPPDPDATCKENPDRVGCQDMGTPEDQGELSTSSISPTSITPTPFASNNTCPADIPLPRGMSVDMSPICDALGWLRPVVIAMAWLSAGLFVVGALRT